MFADRLVSKSDWLSIKRLQGQASVQSAGKSAAGADDATGVMSTCMSQGRSGRVTFGAPVIQGQDFDCVELFGATWKKDAPLHLKRFCDASLTCASSGEGAIILENRSCPKLSLKRVRSDQSLAPSGIALLPNEKRKTDAASGRTTADVTKKPQENVQKPR